MDREFNIRFKLSDVYKLLVMSPVLAVLVFWVMNWPWSSESAPAWVQGVGSVGAILLAWYLGRQQQEREDRRLREERARSRIEQLIAQASSRRAEAARVFYLASEFSFLNMRIDSARRNGEDLSAKRWINVLEDLLVRLSYEPGAESRGMTLIFELRQELLKLIDVLQASHPAWALEFVNTFSSVNERVQGIERQAGIHLEEMKKKLETAAVTGIPGDLFSAVDLGLVGK
ncbi:hypothetical protein [Metapseudomonas otitidis]|uniref:hypothetical protein n=1 Tax=Metapseudomonas otitidis TaxID=319939 RepID=UPI001F3A6E46|nr:hypothetical protein [Pseudomonas otitidis]